MQHLSKYIYPVIKCKTSVWLEFYPCFITSAFCFCSASRGRLCRCCSDKQPGRHYSMCMAFTNACVINSPSSNAFTASYTCINRFDSIYSIDSILNHFKIGIRLNKFKFEDRTGRCKTVSYGPRKFVKDKAGNF